MKTYTRYRDVKYGNGTEIFPSFRICTILKAMTTIQVSRPGLVDFAWKSYIVWARSEDSPKQGYSEFDLCPQETFEVREILSVCQQMYHCNLTI